MKPFNFKNIINEKLSILETKKEVRAWIKSNIKKFRSINQTIIAAAEEFGMEDEIQNKNHWLWKIFKKKNAVMEENNPNDYVRLDRKTGMYCVYSKSGAKLEEFRTESEAEKWANENFDTGVMESVDYNFQESPVHGIGTFAATDIKEEKVIGLYLVNLFEEQLTYQRTDFCRLTNHSTEDYNIKLEQMGDDLHVKATRDIKEGEELLVNYFDAFETIGKDTKIIKEVLKYTEGYEDLEIGPDSHEDLTIELEYLSRLDEKSFKDFETPASPKLKKWIESGTVKILKQVTSILGPTTRFVIVQNPNWLKSGDSKMHDKVLMFTISDPKRGRIKMFSFHGSHLSIAKAMQFAINNKLVTTVKMESVELDEADNTAAVARQLKQAVKKYTTGNLIVRSKGGKTRFIMVAAGHIDNKLRKMILDIVAPNANVRDKDDISYGNISDRIISAETDVWVKALGLTVAVEEGKKVTCPKCDGEGCEHCEDKGYHLEEDYKEMMKWYEKSDEKKVYDILKKNKFNLPADSFTLVQNTLKKSKNVNNAASMIMNKYPQFRKESNESDIINNKTGDQPMNESFAKALQNILESQYTPKKESADLDVVNEGTIGNALDLRAVELQRAADAKKAKKAKNSKGPFRRPKNDTTLTSGSLNASTDNESLTGRDLDEKAMVGDQLITEYLEGYFGGELNESTSDEDIMKAFNDILETADAVEEFMEIQEIASAVGLLRSKTARRLGKGLKTVVRGTGRALVSPKAQSIYKGTAKVVADTVGSVGQGGGNAVRTAFNSTRTQTGI